MAHYLCNRRHTITELICAAGRQKKDWSSDYRFYQSHLDCDGLFDSILTDVVKLIPSQSPLVLAVDDSNFSKRGKTIPNTGWMRDPLGPKFIKTLKWGQKFVQISAAVVPQDNSAQPRVIPVRLSFMEKIPKLKKDATEREFENDKKRRAQNSPSAHCLRMLDSIQSQLKNPRPIILLGDGNYTTSTVLQNLPKNVAYIGRTRGDLHINEVPQPPKNQGAGRPLSYGDKLQ